MSIASISKYDQWKLAHPETYGPWKHDDDCECDVCEEARESKKMSVRCPHCGFALCHGPLLPVLLAKCGHCGHEINGGGGQYWKTKAEAEHADAAREDDEAND